MLLTAFAAAANGDNGSQQTGFFETTHEEITWQFYVPPNYNPEQPAGLLVYISPTPSGAMPKKWRSVMDDNNLIWIGADKSGNRITASRRVLLSLLAVDRVKEDYVIDEDHVYLSGFSGGGRVASRVIIDNTDVFTGGLFFCGADLWHLDTSPSLKAMREHRFVLITGTLDQALEPVKRTYRGYRKAGIENTKLMNIRGMGHSTPRRSDFAKAIAFLLDNQ